MDTFAPELSCPIMLAEHFDIYPLHPQQSLGKLFAFLILISLLYRVFHWYKKRTGSKNIDETLEKAKTEANSMVNEIKEKVDTMREKASEAHQSVSSQVSERYDSVKTDVKSEVNEILDSAKEYVNKEDTRNNQ